MHASVKVKNLLKNDNVTIAVYSGEEAVIIRGKGRIIQDDEEFVKRLKSTLTNVVYDLTSR